MDHSGHLIRYPPQRNGDSWRIFQGMDVILNALKIAALIVLVVVTLGVVPDKKWGAVYALAACVVAAVVLHFVAP